MVMVASGRGPIGVDAGAIFVRNPLLVNFDSAGGHGDGYGDGGSRLGGGDGRVKVDLQINGSSTADLGRPLAGGSKKGSGSICRDTANRYWWDR